MKRFDKISLDATAARTQLSDFETLLKSKATLDERADILPFFGKNRQLGLLFAYYIEQIKLIDSFATEFVIEGDFKADLEVGDSKAGRYLLVEFEDGKPNSVFSQGKKAYPDYATRFEGAFSQLVDWIWRLDDVRSTTGFEHVFGRRDILFQGLIVIGKEMKLDKQEQDRLRWRQQMVQIASTRVSVISFEQFREDADHWLSAYHRA